MTAASLRDSMKNRHLVPKIKKVITTSPDLAKVYFSLSETHKNKTVDSLYYDVAKEGNEWKLSSLSFLNE